MIIVYFADCCKVKSVSFAWLKKMGWRLFLQRPILILNGNRSFCNFVSKFSKAVPLASTVHDKNTKSSEQAPIVILHGFLGSKNNWNSLSKLINERTGLKVYALDHRNHGESPHTTEMDYTLMAEDIQLFLKNNNIDKVKLVGHSLGGRAAIKFSLMFPKVVEQLVVVDVSHVRRGAKTVSREPADILQVLSELDLSAAKNLSQARSLVEKSLIPVCSSKPTRLFLSTNVYCEENNNIKWRCNLDTLKKVFAISLMEYPQPVKGTYEGPTTFIAGADSDYLIPQDHDEILLNFPHAKIHYISGAGHFVHAEKPFEFLDILIPAVGH